MSSNQDLSGAGISEIQRQDIIAQIGLNNDEEQPPHEELLARQFYDLLQEEGELLQ